MADQSEQLTAQAPDGSAAAVTDSWCVETTKGELPTESRRRRFSTVAVTDKITAPAVEKAFAGLKVGHPITLSTGFTDDGLATRISAINTSGATHEITVADNITADQTDVFMTLQVPATFRAILHAGGALNLTTEMNTDVGNTVNQDLQHSGGVVTSLAYEASVEGYVRLNTQWYDCMRSNFASLWVDQHSEVIPSLTIAPVSGETSAVITGPDGWLAQVVVGTHIVLNGMVKNQGRNDTPLFVKDVDTTVSGQHKVTIDAQIALSAETVTNSRVIVGAYLRNGTNVTTMTLAQDAEQTSTYQHAVKCVVAGISITAPPKGEPVSCNATFVTGPGDWSPRTSNPNDIAYDPRPFHGTLLSVEDAKVLNTGNSVFRIDALGTPLGKGIHSIGEFSFETSDRYATEPRTKEDDDINSIAGYQNTALRTQGFSPTGTFMSTFTNFNGLNTFLTGCSIHLDHRSAVKTCEDGTQWVVISLPAAQITNVEIGGSAVDAERETTLSYKANRWENTDSNGNETSYSAQVTVADVSTSPDLVFTTTTNGVWDLSSTATASLGYLTYTLKDGSGTLQAQSYGGNGDLTTDIDATGNAGGDWTLNIDYAGNIATLDLNTQLLTGAIPSALNELIEATSINLADNAFTGTVPDLDALVNLTLLNLSGNSLDGIGKLPDLSKNNATIDLSDNALSIGEVNVVLSKLAAVQACTETGIIQLDGTNGIPDASTGGVDGTAAIATLTGRGWTVNVSS